MGGRPVILLLFVSGLLDAHDVITTKITFSREISRILYKRCAGCHREGGKAPMALLTYEESRPWAKAIKEEVLERRMPPWGAVRGFGSFQNDASLTQEEVSLIAEWVEGGAPEGEARYLPPVPALAEPVKVTGRRIPVRNGAMVRGLLAGIEARVKAEVQSVRVFADQPDGSSLPLIWLRHYKPQWARAFAFRKPVAVAPGTRIRVEPEGQAQLFLITR